MKIYDLDGERTPDPLVYVPVLYGCEIWSFALSEEQRLREFENKVLRKIFGGKRDDITG